MKSTSKLFLAVALIVFVIFIISKKGVLPLVHGVIGNSMKELKIGKTFKLTIPSNWILFVIKEGEKQKLFGYIPYEYFSGKRGEELIASLLIPYNDGYSPVLFLRMNNEDLLNVQAIKKRLLSEGDGYNSSKATYSRCYIDEWECYKVESLSDTNDSALLYLPEISVMMSVSKDLLDTPKKLTIKIKGEGEEEREERGRVLNGEFGG